jgi:lipopolysaccharide transport system ATP-binding protein
MRLRLFGHQPDITLRLDCSFLGELGGRRALVAFDITDSLRTPLMQVLPVAAPFVTDSKQDLRFEITLPPLVPGKYWITAWAGPHYTETFDAISECLSFEIGEPPTPNRTFPYSGGHGFVVPICRYEHLPIDTPA